MFRKLDRYVAKWRIYLKKHFKNAGRQISVNMLQYSKGTVAYYTKYYNKYTLLSIESIL